MKFSFSTKGWNLPEWGDYLEKARDLGYEGIEIHDIHNPTFTGKNAVFDQNMVRATYRNLQEMGLSVPCIDSVCDIGDPAEFDVTATEIAACIETAASLKIPYVRIRACGTDVPKTEDTVYRYLKALVPEAEQKGVTLLLETVGIYADTARLMQMLDRFACDIKIFYAALTVCGYVYCSAGTGESTQDLVFGGTALIYENGSLLAENERFSLEPTFTAADIDIERLDTHRQKISTFAAVSPDGTAAAEYSTLYSRISTGKPAKTDFSAKLLRHIEAHPFVPSGEDDGRCTEILSIQVTGLASRLSHLGQCTAVIGISGGLDSTLALLVTVLAFDRLGRDRKNIIGVTMPGYGTTGRTHGNASGLMSALGITQKEISIAPACDRHFLDIGHDKHVHDVTYENSQARERTQILMDIANSTGGIVVGTGDLSELALGWATYNGDHMSMYGVNASIPKTLVRHLVKWCADRHFGDGAQNDKSAKEILYDIIDTPISPELLPADDKGNISQKTEDLVGPYELHDFFLYNLFRNGYSPDKLLFLAQKAFAGIYDGDTIKKWLKTFLRRFFSQQFKRSCLPDGPKVGSVSLSPRGDWRMPSDAKAALFLEGLDD